MTGIARVVDPAVGIYASRQHQH